MVDQPDTVLSQLHDIYGMTHIPFWQTSAFYGVVIGMGLLLLVLLAWYLIRRSRRRIQQPWERALQELDKLERLGLVHSDQSKLFYYELTRIIKEYLQQRFALSLTSKTDDELIVLSTSWDVADEVKQGLREVLDGVIFIKFAHAAAARERMQRDLSVGKALIVATRPQKK